MTDPKSRHDPQSRLLWLGTRTDEPYCSVASGGVAAHESTARVSIPQRIADRTKASVVKKLLSTAPMLMYQHSRSGVSMPGR